MIKGLLSPRLNIADTVFMRIKHLIHNIHSFYKVLLKTLKNAHIFKKSKFC